MSEHESYMTEALELALRGIGTVEPNPMVGAVIVRDGGVIGRGWTQPFGHDHAEVAALADAREAGEKTAGATMYVTLEPCCHYGKTPPCTQAIIDAKIAKVVTAMLDPFDQVAGGGVAKLRGSGVEVTVGVMEAAARRRLAAYVKLQTVGRPWVICKWAQTLDGRIATRTGHSQWISGEASRRRVQKIRSYCDGVMVGVGTVLADDPMLTNRSGAGREPTRVVLDEALATPADCRLVQTASETPVLIVTAAGESSHAEKLAAAGAELLHLPGDDGRIDLGGLMDELGRRRWTRLLIEGGAQVHGSMLGAGLVDELRVFLAPRLLGGREGLPCVLWREADLMTEAKGLPRPTVEAIDGDLLLSYWLAES